MLKAYCQTLLPVLSLHFLLHLRKVLEINGVDSLPLAFSIEHSFALCIVRFA